MSTNSLSQKILQFWFGGSPSGNAKLWWGKSADTDARIKAAHTQDIDRAMRDEFESWEFEPETILALIILLDQFPRTIYRGTPKMYECDPRARELALKAINQKMDQELTVSQRAFLYMPFEHAENAGKQQLCVDLFKEMLGQADEKDKAVCQGFLDFAIAHQKVIDQFGRFPHRNKILGRKSTPEEIEYLSQPNAGF